MRLGGYLALTLKDDPGYLAAVCFTQGCPLRCPYCHNSDLVLPSGGADATPLPATEFLDYLRRRHCQLDSVVISGGEPLLQPDLPDFLADIRSLGLRIKLDTSGALPDLLLPLLRRHLIDFVALDFKNSRDRLAETCGLSGPAMTADDYGKHWCQTQKILQVERVDHEIRTTVVREIHPLPVLKEMAMELAAAGAYETSWFLQTFRRSGPLLADRIGSDLTMTAYQPAEMKMIQATLTSIIPTVQLR